MFDFETMDKKKRALYECMWGSPEFSFPVEKTWYKGDRSSNSYTFSGTSTVDGGILTVDEDTCREKLAEIFGIINRALFKDKFHQSISGSGQELKRIATLHSSSLCALLFFYQVTEENPYSMVLDGEEYVFTCSCFEYQNPVIKGRNPSNMDVVLVGKNEKNGKPVVLFLESKFSEYYERLGNELKKIAKAYLENKYSKPLYERAFLKTMKMHIEEEGKSDFTLVLDEPCEVSYLEGIKQMISHYVGVRNFCDGKRVTKDSTMDAVSRGAKVLLGEILFTLPFEDGKNCLDSYQKNYCILAKELNQQIAHDGKGAQIAVLSDVLSYSQFKESGCVKEERIKQFYFESGKNEICKK